VPAGLAAIAKTSCIRIAFHVNTNSCFLSLKSNLPQQIAFLPAGYNPALTYYSIHEKEIKIKLFFTVSLHSLHNSDGSAKVL
jgi:hypothetical protein